MKIRFYLAIAVCLVLSGCSLTPSIVPATEVTRSDPPPEDLTFTLPGNLPLEMKGIGPGVFVMGGQALYTTIHEMGRKVTLTQKFWLGKFEITREQYCAVMGIDKIEHLKYCFARRLTDENLPVCCVSWNEAKSFAEKLNTMFKDKLPAGYSFDLPSAAQWEYACRAGTTGAFNDNSGLPVKISENTDSKKSGDEYIYTFLEESKTLDKLAWYKANSALKLHPVGGKAPNQWGLYDMHGNIAELCRDRMVIYPFTSNLYSYENVIDPLGGQLKADVFTKTSARESRGGNYLLPAKFLTSWRRDFKLPDKKNFGTGFRIALVAPSVAKIDKNDTRYYSLNQSVVKLHRQMVLNTALIIGQCIIEHAPEILDATSDIIDSVHTLKHGSSAKGSGANSMDSSFSGSGSIRGNSTLRRGATATYQLYVNGSKVNASWRAAGTSISVNDCGSYARVMAGNPPVSAGKTFNTRISATYRGKTFYKTITIAK